MPEAAEQGVTTEEVIDTVRTSVWSYAGLKPPTPEEREAAAKEKAEADAHAKEYREVSLAFMKRGLQNYERNEADSKALIEARDREVQAFERIADALEDLAAKHGNPIR